MWWLVFSANRTTLSSIEGQYRGPVDWICPEYIGARCKFALISSWIPSFVAPNQQQTCGSGGVHASPLTPSPGTPGEGRGGGSPLTPYSFKYENGLAGRSPSCISNAPKSI